jgi:heptaprenylglyceryl phosphate synthase
MGAIDDVVVSGGSVVVVGGSVDVGNSKTVVVVEVVVDAGLPLKANS